jgi:hypothetical protein
MWHEITAWQEKLNLRPDLSAKTVALYTQDARLYWLLGTSVRKMAGIALACFIFPEL